MLQIQSYALALSLILHTCIAFCLANGSVEKPQRMTQIPIHIRIVDSQSVGKNSALSQSKPVLSQVAAIKRVEKPKKRPNNRSIPPANKPVQTPSGLEFSSQPTQAHPPISRDEVSSTAPNSNGSGLEWGPRLLRSSVQEPDYAPDALAAAFQGVLIVEVTIAPSGQVIEANLRNPSGFSIDQSVVMAARRARYHPALAANGQPTWAKTRLSFDFRIPNLSH